MHVLNEPTGKIEEGRERTFEKVREIVKGVIIKVRCPYCRKTYETLVECPHCGAVHA